jgi:predicted esterase
MNNLPKKNLLLFIILVFVLLYTSISIFKNRHRNSEIHHADDLSWVQTSKGFLHIQTYKNITSIDSINLFVIIHGDAPFEKPDYQYRMAQKIASDNRNSVAVGILRPGYTDPANNTSNGIKGFTTGDNYTLEVIQAIAETIELLKNKYKPAKIILIGHSGGAAIAGDIIGMRPPTSEYSILGFLPLRFAKMEKAHE